MRTPATDGQNGSFRGGQRQPGRKTGQLSTPARMVYTSSRPGTAYMKERYNMKLKTIVIWINLAVAVVLAGTLLAQAQESLFGTWKMNAAKSKFSPGPAPKSSIASNIPRVRCPSANSSQ